MFLETEELKSVAYNYQLEEITEDDDDILTMAISAAVEEMKSYLRPTRTSPVQYDVEAIFGATGSDRNPLILELCKSIALYYIIRLANVDILEQRITERYKRAIDWLEKVSGTGASSGNNTISPDLNVIINIDNNGNGTGTGTGTGDDNTVPFPFRFGSREKFNHE